MGVSPDGLTLPSGAEILEDMVADFEASGEFNLNLPGGIEGNLTLTLMAIVAKRISSTLSMIQEVYDSTRPEATEGIHAEDAAFMVGIEPEAATYSTATLTFTGTSGTVIPEGSLFEGGGSDGKARWTLLESVTLSGGTGSGTVQAQVAGPVSAEAAAITKIVTAVSGLTAVSNAAAAEEGRYREDGAALRSKRRRAIAQGGAASIAAIRASVLDHPDVDECEIIENRLNTSATVSGKSMAPNSIWVIVTPDTLTTEAEVEVASLIHRKLAPGTRMMSSGGATEVIKSVVIRGTQSTRQIAWDYGENVATTITATVTLKSGYSLSDVELAIKTAVDAHFDTLGLGAALREYDLIIATKDIDGIADIGFTASVGSLPYTPTISQTLTLTSTTVTT